MHIYTIRHGQSIANAHKIVSGSQETPLGELGKHQVRISAEKLAHLKIDLIVCSPMRRALDSAKIIADALQYPHSEIKTINELRERGLGDLEGRSYAANDDLSGNTIAAEQVNGVEPLDQFHSRVFAALREITGSRHHQNVLIVCHMNVGRMLQAIVHNLPAASMYEMPRLENAATQKLI